MREKFWLLQNGSYGLVNLEIIDIFVHNGKKANSPFKKIMYFKLF